MMDKGIDSLIPGQQLPADPSPDFLDHLAFTLHLTGQYQNALPFCIQLIDALPESHRGFLRLANIALADELHKLAMLSYACAFQRASDSNVQDFCTTKIVQCSKHTEWGTVIMGDEMSQLPGELAVALLAPWPSSLRSVISDTDTVPTLCLEPRQGLHIPIARPSSSGAESSYQKLPRFFRWLVPFHFAIMSTPKNEADIAVLASLHLGIRHISTLTEEEPLRKSWFVGKAITNTFLSIRNENPPSIEQMDIIMNLFRDETNLPLLVHCGGGKGRAGTVAACYLAAYGYRKPKITQNCLRMKQSTQFVLSGQVV